MKTEEAVGKIRSFNRYYTNLMGLLKPNIYGTGQTLTETRILYEIYEAESSTLKALSEKMNMDKGYLSRIISELEQQGLIKRVQAQNDRRSVNIMLTTNGTELVRQSIDESNRQVLDKVNKLSAGELDELCRALDTVRGYLEQEAICVMW